MAILGPESARVLLDTLALMLMGVALIGVSTHRLDRAILLLAAQGAVLTAAAVTVALADGGGHGLAAVILTLAVKALAIPGVLYFASRETRLRPEIEVALPYHLAWSIAVGLILVAYQIVGPLGPIDEYGTTNALPAAVSVLLIGLFTMLIRRGALSQVGGLVTMENGIYLSALMATRGLPLAVELGIALDLLVGVAVMGLVSQQIHRAFATTNTDHLRSLKG